MAFPPAMAVSRYFRPRATSYQPELAHIIVQRGPAWGILADGDGQEWFMMVCRVSKKALIKHKQQILYQGQTPSNIAVALLD